MDNSETYVYNPMVAIVPLNVAVPKILQEYGFPPGGHNLYSLAWEQRLCYSLLMALATVTRV
jgi:hypothetical protein